MERTLRGFHAPRGIMPGDDGIALIRQARTISDDLSANLETAILETTIARTCTTAIV